MHQYTYQPAVRGAAISAALGLLATLAGGCASAGVDTLAESSSTQAAMFRVRHEIQVPVPAGGERVRVWFPIPRGESVQDVADFEVQASVPWSEVGDDHGNRYVYVDAPAGAGDVSISTSFTLTRREQVSVLDPAKTRPLTDAERKQYAAYLQPNRHIVLDEETVQLAERIVDGEQNPLLAARKLYDWTLDNIEYWVKDPARWKASAVGSSDYCRTTGTGNCTDFHSLWTALARSRGIPTRLKYGSLFKPTLDGGDRDASYHCWPESWFPGLGWVPNDVAVADIYHGPIALDASNRDKVELTTALGYKTSDPSMVDYYFGGLDNRRVAWTEGRDLALQPPAAAGPVNAVAKGYVEIDDEPFAGFSRTMTYREMR